MKALRFSHHAAVAVIAASAFALTSCGSGNATTSPADTEPAAGPKVTGTLAGVGSSAQAAAMDVWTANFAAANQGASVQYSPDGSGAGRKAVLDGSAQFAGSDAFLNDEELTKSKLQCGPEGAMNIPVYISPIAIAFNVPGITDLKLDAITVAKLFRGEIHKWNDPAIAALNPEAKLPDLAITPVSRSDDSGTTKNFTEYLSAAAPEVWKGKADGVWPASLKGEKAKGTSGVVDMVVDIPGAITYADDSAVGDALGTVRIKVGSEFVKISPEAASKAVDSGRPADGHADHDPAIELDRTTTDSGAYPVVMVSYHVVCSAYDDQATVDLVKAFEKYVVSEQGQKAAAESAQSAPLSSVLTEKATKAIQSIKIKS